MAQWDTKERYCCTRLRWSLSIEMGCIMADLFMVLMYLRGAHLSVSAYTWLERMEISCRVNVTPSVCHSSFLRAVCWAQLWYFSPTKWPWTRIKEGLLAAAAFLCYDKEQSQKRERRLILLRLGREHLPNAFIGEQLIAAGVYLTWLKNTLIISQA